jgi:glutamine amidotransferase
VKIAIIKYNAGNIQSVQFALQRLGIEAIVTDQAEQIQQADRVIFPGVGEASSTMQYLKSKRLDEIIINLKQPVLGICLGMQLMCQYSEENNTTCLGIFEEEVKQFIPSNNMKVPHMGWNQLKLTTGWLANSLHDERVYFVHSYYVPVNLNTSAVTDYGVSFSAAMNKNNFFAVQFHPEKSAQAGELVLQQFLRV